MAAIIALFPYTLSFSFLLSRMHTVCLLAFVFSYSSPLLRGGQVELNFARMLANNEKSVRTKAVKKLALYLKRDRGMSCS